MYKLTYDSSGRVGGIRWGNMDIPICPDNTDFHRLEQGTESSAGLEKHHCSGCAGAGAGLGERD